MSARYWLWFAFKLVAVAVFGVISYLIAARTLFPSYALNSTFNKVQNTVDGLLMGFWLIPLVCAGLLYLCVVDQRYRCRTCLRKLRMPVNKGSRSALLLNHPGTEWVCPYGHGKLLVQVWVSDRNETTWTRHGDMWTELFRQTPKR